MRKKIRFYPHIVWGFTLVELVIVVTILVILATIALMGYQWFASLSRDAARLSTAKNIESAMELYHTKTGFFPALSTWAIISVWSLGNISTQGILDENICRVINLSPVPVDPLTFEPYRYIVNTALTWYKTLFYLEREKETVFVQPSYASLQYANPMTMGVWPWVLLKTTGEMIDEASNLFWNASGATFQVIPDSNISLSWNGKSLWGGMAFYAQKWWDLTAPTSCKEGFIPVAWDPHFLQPWFCVAKYEMALEIDLWLDELSWENDWNTWIGSTASTSTGLVWNDGLIVSEAWKFPIANITQIQSIKACESIATHLVSNNEWMTIARQIENNPKNWSTWKVGAWNIYHGMTQSSYMGCSGFAGTHYDDYNTTKLNKYWVKTWDKHTAIPWKSCDSRRQHILENWEIIWDLIWNVNEHVNAANTTNWELYNSFYPVACDNSLRTGSYAYNYYSDEFDSTTQCVFKNEYSLERFGPSWFHYNADMGMWKVYSYKWANVVNNRILKRWGNANDNKDAWLYSLETTSDATYSERATWFRCAY